MGTVALKALNVPASPDGYQYFDQITFSPGSPPGRPTPGPTPPGSGGGPVDPGYSPPWAQLPVDPGYGIDIGGYPGNPPRPTHPIFLPGMPGWPSTPPGGGGGGTPSPGPGMQATIIPIPATEPPTPPPAGMSPSAVQVVVWMGPGTKPTTGWVNPYISTGPVTPPTETAPPPA